MELAEKTRLSYAYCLTSVENWKDSQKMIEGTNAYWKDVLSAFDSQASLDVLDHPVLNLIFYMLVEILPSALVLYILRKLPPKRVSKYNPIH